MSSAPQCRITIDGILASGVMMSRLISCEVTDKEGVASDSATIVLNNSPAAAIPRRGAKVRIWFGYKASQLTFMGTFVVDEVEVALFPHIMTINAKAANLRDKMKENKERHWDNTSVADIVGEIASDNGMTAKVDPEIGAHVYDWFGQQDESDVHVLRRLESRHGALFSDKDGALVFAKRGSGKTPSGASLSRFVVTPDNILEGSGRISFSDRAEYSKVVGYHQDTDEIERVEVVKESSDDGTAIYRLGEPFANKAEAERAAHAKAKDLKRQAIKFSCDVVGSPQARAGAPLVFEGMEVGIDGIEFIIETAKHSWSKTGYPTSLDGKLKV